MNLMKYRFELGTSLERMLNEDQVGSIKDSLPHARRYLNLLVQRLEKDLDDEVRKEESLINYENPNWALLQAESLGYRRALRDVIKTIRPIEE